MEREINIMGKAGCGYSQSNLQFLELDGKEKVAYRLHIAGKYRTPIVYGLVKSEPCQPEASLKRQKVRVELCDDKSDLFTRVKQEFDKIESGLNVVVWTWNLPPGMYYAFSRGCNPKTAL